jgi:hypothetical protein
VLCLDRRTDRLPGLYVLNDDVAHRGLGGDGEPRVVRAEGDLPSACGTGRAGRLLTGVQIEDQGLAAVRSPDGETASIMSECHRGSEEAGYKRYPDDVAVAVSKDDLPKDIGGCEQATVRAERHG